MKVLKHLRGSSLDEGYRMHVSITLENPAWDAFLAEVPGGHYAQTSLWAQAKASHNWRPLRVAMTQEERIVAGAQMLTRPLPIVGVGAIGYVPKGPVSVAHENSSELMRRVTDRLYQEAKAQGVQLLAVQPPRGNEAFTEYLAELGFRPSSRGMPTATLLLDLCQSLDDILAQMKSKTRYNIRLAQRKGVSVREGTKDDLSTFYKLHMHTGQRQQFTSFEASYLVALWDLLEPHDHVKLFLANYQGEAISALLMIAFGDTVTYWRGGWSGRHGNLHPNEAAQWAAMRWAKAQGYRFYDLGGLDLDTARAAVRGEAPPTTKSPSHFKLGFGGDVAFLPGACDYIYNPILRWSYTSVLPKIPSRAVAAVESALRGSRHAR